MRSRPHIFTLVILLLVLSGPVFAQVFPPKPEGQISDHFGQVHVETEKKVEEIADELRKVTSVNLVVVVVRNTEPMKADDYARKLYDDWDVGRKEQGLEHGILVLFSVLDRQVRIQAGPGVDFILTPKIREDMQWAAFPLLGRGRISQAVHIVALSISRFVLEEYPKYERMRRTRIDMHQLSVVGFFLFMVAVLLTIIFGQSFLAAFGMLVGGLFGYVLLDMFGLVVGAVMGFLINFWLDTGQPKESQAEKEARAVYEEFKAGKPAKGPVIGRGEWGKVEKKEAKNEDKG